MEFVAYLTSWLTPGSLFLVLNIMIGTIVLTSKLTSKKPLTQHHPDGRVYSPQLARSPSLLDRVRSINFSLYKFEHHVPEPEHHHQYYPEHESAHRVDPPPLPRAPSFFERLKSINFSPYKFEHHPEHEPELTHHVDSPAPATNIDRAPSLLQLVKSIKVSSFRRPEYVNHGSDPVVHTEPELPSADPNSGLLDMDQVYEQQVKRVNSDTKPSGGEPLSRLSTKMKKSASEKSAFGHFEEESELEARRPKTMKEGKNGGGNKQATSFREEEEEEDQEAEEIDAKADDFINRFKKQLKLQRLDSILRYKEMLSRGVAGSG